MIIDEWLLVYTHTQEDPPPARLSTRAKISNSRRSAAAAAAAAADTPKEEPPIVGPATAMHSLDELALIGSVDAMPVMQSTRRVRAPTTMAARPRLGRLVIAKPVFLPKRIPGAAAASGTKRAPRATTAPGLGSQKTRNPRRKITTVPVIPVVRTIVTHLSIIVDLVTTDTLMKEQAMILANLEINSEPALPIHTAIRIVLQASLNIGRPYDTNMLAATFGTTRSLVMQALRKYYDTFTEQSIFTEADFVPTYLWIYGLSEEKRHALRVIKAIEVSKAGEPGCRSVFAVARDFVILYVSEVVYGEKSGFSELAGLSSVALVMQRITPPPEVLPCFLEMTNSFIYRARMTGRQVMRANEEFGGRIESLFAI